MKQLTAMLVLLVTFGLVPLGVDAAPTAKTNTSSLSLGSYGEVLVENLAIGENYSMIKLINMPFEAKYKGDAPVNLILQVEKPQPNETKPGFEPIPEKSWVTFGNTMVALAANGSYKTDVVISIPNDKQYLGKKYHAALVATLASGIPGDTSVRMGVIGRLLFTVAPMEKPLRSKDNQSINLDFTFQPELLKLENVKLGKKVKVLSADNKPVKIKNSGDAKIVLIMSSLNPKDTILAMVPGYEACPDREFIQFEESEIEIGAGKEKALHMTLEIPDRPEFRDKKYQFVVSFSNELTSGSKYLRMLVTTSK